jgi:RNA polymerase sigma-70 factor (ECF subfamily)
VLTKPISLPTDLSDEEVVRRVRAGETSLYEVIMRRYNQRLYRITRTILRDSHEAEDVIQEAYVRAYSHLDQFEGNAKFATWLTKIAVYEALGRLRKRKRQLGLAEQSGEEPDTTMPLKSSEPNPEERALGQEARALLEAAVDALPEHYRAVFVLRQIEDLSTAETAECLDLTEETVKVRLHRSREMLRNELYERAGAESSSAFQFLGPRCDAVVAGVMSRLRH